MFEKWEAELKLLLRLLSGPFRFADRLAGSRPPIIKENLKTHCCVHSSDCKSFLLLLYGLPAAKPTAGYWTMWSKDKTNACVPIKG